MENHPVKFSGSSGDTMSLVISPITVYLHGMPCSVLVARQEQQ